MEWEDEPSLSASHNKASKGRFHQPETGPLKKKPCYDCGTVPSHPISKCLSRKVTCYKCSKEGPKGNSIKVHEVKVQLAVAAQYQNCIPEEYIAVYFNADGLTISTVAGKSLNNPKPESQIRPLRLSKAISSQIYCIDCKANTGASCNILPLYKVRTLFGENIQEELPTVKLIAFNDSPINNLSSIIVFL